MASSVAAGFALTPEESFAAGGPSVRRSLIYNAPTDGTSIGTIVAEADQFVGGKQEAGYLARLRANGFKGQSLQYFLANEAVGPGPYANSAAGCQGGFAAAWHNNLTFEADDFCNNVHKNESWFLHNGKGQRIFGRNGNGIAYRMNPGNPEWQKFVVARILRHSAGQPSATNGVFDGIFLDNIAAQADELRKRTENSDGTVREYATDNSYRDAQVSYLKYLHAGLASRGPLWMNLIDDSGVSAADQLRLISHVEGYLAEGFAMGWVGSDKTPAQWEVDINVMEASLASGKGVYANVQGSKGDLTRQTAGLASYLLASDTRSMFRYSNASNYKEWWQYDNYNISLGRPKGARFQAGGEWRRDFECGYVAYNTATRTGRLSQTSCSSLPATTSTTRPSTSTTGLSTSTTRPTTSTTGVSTSTTRPSTSTTGVSTSSTGLTTSTGIPATSTTAPSAVTTPVSSSITTSVNMSAPVSAVAVLGTSMAPVAVLAETGQNSVSYVELAAALVLFGIGLGAMSSDLRRRRSA